MIARPKHTCLNYPLCTGQQHRLRASGASPQWLPHCKSCLDRAVPCSFPDCRNPRAPGSARLAPPFTCAVHYKHPAERHRCKWNLCENSTKGCRELSITLTGRRCFLCASKAYPCLYATEGCPNRVRSHSSKMPPRLPACRTHPACCPYAPSSNGTAASSQPFGVCANVPTSSQCQRALSTSPCPIAPASGSYPDDSVPVDLSGPSSSAAKLCPRPGSLPTVDPPASVLYPPAMRMQDSDPASISFSVGSPMSTHVTSLRSIQHVPFLYKEAVSKSCEQSTEGAMVWRLLDESGKR